MRRSTITVLLLWVAAFSFVFHESAIAQKSGRLEYERLGEEGHQQEMIDWYNHFVNPTGRTDIDAYLQQGHEEWKHLNNAPLVAAGSSAAWQQIGTSLDGGSTSGRATCIAFDPTDANVIYLGTSQGGLWKTADAGKTWVSLSDSWSTLAMGGVAVDPKDHNVIYAGTGDYWGIGGVGLYKSVDGGLNWNLISNNIGSSVYQMFVSPDSSNLVYATGAGGVSLSSDGGVTWKITGHASGSTYMVIDPSNASVIYAAGGGSIRKSEDYGRTWRVVYSVSGTMLMTLGISPKDPLKVYCHICTNMTSEVVRSTDSGATWTVRKSGLTLLNSGGNSQGWYANALTVNPNNADDVAIGGLDIYRSKDGGVTFQRMTNSQSSAGTSDYSHADVHFLLYNGNTLYALSDGGVYYSKTYGASWSSDMNHGLSTFQFVGGDVSPDFKTAYAGAQDNNVDRITIGDTYWSTIHGGDGGNTMVSQTDGQIVYSTWLGATLYRSDDGGETWAVGPAGSNDLLGGNPIENESPNGYMDYDVSESDPTIIALCGTSHVYLAVDGSTFNNVTPGTTTGGAARCVHIAKADPNYLYVGGGSYVYYSTDQGSSWTRSKTQMPSVTAITTDAVEPTHVYAASGSSTHFMFSTDTGRTWTKPVTNLPSGTYNRIAVAPDGQLFISNTYGVLRSQDGGTTWFPIKEGMPDAAITSLRVRGPNGRYLIATTYGRGMYSLDLSQLPPVPTNGVTPSAPVVSNASQPSITSVYPNPVLASNGHGTVSFSLPAADRMTLSLYDLMGRQERVLANEWMTAGAHEQELDLTNLAAGRHFIVLTANGHSVTQAVTVE